MAIAVPFDLAYEFDVKAPVADVFAVLSDVPLSASHFPRVERLVDLGGNAFRWEMERVGTAQIGIQTVYAAKYVANKKAGSVIWTPVKGEGNASIGGSWTLSDRKGATHLLLKIHGDLTLPLPGVMKLVVVPVVVSENKKLIEKYIANLTERFGGKA